MNTKVIAPILLTLVLTACGGGGGGGAASNPDSKIAVATLAQTNTVYTEAVGDINNDGLEDVVVSGWNRDSSTAYMYLFTQNANGTLTNQTSLLGNNVIGGSQRILLSDFDHDGYVDIFVPGFSDGAAMHQENSVMFWGTSTSFTRQNWSDNSTAHGSCIADMNNDGLDDILIAGSGVWINNGNRVFTLNALFANNYFTACAVIKEANSNTVYLSNNFSIVGSRDVIAVYDFQLNLVSRSGFQTDNNYDTVNVIAVDLTGDGHKDFVISMNGINVPDPGARKLLAYTAPNTYTNVVNLSSGRNAYYDHAINLHGTNGVLFSGDGNNAEIFSGTSKVYTNGFASMIANNSFKPANIYQNASTGGIYMLQLINNTFYTQELK